MAEIAECDKPSKHEKMEALRKQLAALECPESSDEDVQRPRCAPRRERTEKQKEAFVKAQATRLAKAEERKREKALKEQEEKAELEQKLIEKAIKVKKKQIKKMAAIEQLSDDDTIEAPRRAERREAERPKVQFEKPKLKFV